LPFFVSFLSLIGLFSSSRYDYIFCGAGCASLSLLMRMIRSGKFADKKILLAEKEPKTQNDRTWCFWETKPGFFEEIVYRKWDTISFLSDDFSAEMSISPYQYKMIRGIDFYNYCFDEISKQRNIDVVYGNLTYAGSHKEGTTVIIDGREHNQPGGIVFNSIPKQGSTAGLKLLQHFKGWVVETEKPVFKPGVAIMMDFRVHQDYGTTFAYVLPANENEALIEYTLFTKDVLRPDQYDSELKIYLHDFLKIDKYSIRETETGIIPMTNEQFQFYEEGRFNIGTAGGQTKASSGYTFQFIQKQSQRITNCLIQGSSLLTIKDTPKRFRFYDNTLLHILYHHKLPGKKIFTRLFQKNSPPAVLRFLDNESTLYGELKIISSLPALPFLKAAIKQF
jgi:lycopene beta-cyclase